MAPVAILRRYWFEFVRPVEGDRRSPFSLGFGVTAWTEDDARHLLRERVFRDHPVIEIAHVQEDVDVSSLDPGHVLPNIGDPTQRGVWFPKGY